MPYTRRAHAAISGSRSRPCAVYALPENPVPSSFSIASTRTACALLRRATSVAVTPRARALSQPSRSVWSATIRSV
jgi:hypothetical protein